MQLRRVRGRVEDTYRYRNRTCRCRLGLTHLLSAWFSLGVRSKTDRGKTNDGDATSIHPCTEGPRRPSYESSSSCIGHHQRAELEADVCLIPTYLLYSIRTWARILGIATSPLHSGPFPSCWFFCQPSPRLFLLHCPSSPLLYRL